MSVTAERSQRTKSKMGRPERPDILALEGHVSEIIILKDDQAFLRRTGVALRHLQSHISDGIRTQRWEIVERANGAIGKLVNAQIDRFNELGTTLIPEVVACYNALETAVA